MICPFNYRMKDEVAGEVPIAFVVKANGSNINEEEIKQYVSQQVNIIFLLVRLKIKNNFFFYI